eukprot:COSAG02_NODE_303_length_25213_cov_126.386199_17_plen_81_part_00
MVDHVLVVTGLSAWVGAETGRALGGSARGGLSGRGGWARCGGIDGRLCPDRRGYGLGPAERTLEALRATQASMPHAARRW